MTDLRTRYLGLDLPSPIVVGSCGLTQAVGSMQRLEDAGAGAVVLKSLFEEQITLETDRTLFESTYHAEAEDYLGYFVKENQLGETLNLIAQAKAALQIPVIASINCMTAGNWTHFAKRIEQAGADAIELNVFVLPADVHARSEDLERLPFDVADRVRAATSLPIAVKLAPYYTNLASVIQRLSKTGIEGLVLFNRFYAPDIDIESETPVPAEAVSSPVEIAQPLRWVGLLADAVDCDLAASTGAHDGEAVIKLLLAGATAVQMVSAIYKGSPSVVTKANDAIETWMEDHGYESLDDFRGSVSAAQVANPAFYQRIQFMKHFAGMS